MDKNVETALRYLKDPSYIPFLEKLKKAAVTTLSPLSASAFPSKEPIPFEEARSLSFLPVKKGDPWGGMFECAWFRFTAELPSGGREDLALVLDVGGEGCVYDRTGVVQGITKVLGAVDFLQILPGKQLVPLDRLAIEGDALEVWVDCGNNGFSGISTGQSRLQRADLCRVRRDVIGLYYDFLACAQLAAMKDAPAYLKGLLKQVMARAGKLPGEEVAACREILAPMFDGSEKAPFTVYAQGHGHLDMAWLWPIRETKRKALRTFSNVLYQSTQAPGFSYNASQPQQFEFVRENAPELFEKIKEAAKTGTVEPQGGMWVEPDTNLSGGESLIRQCVYGKRYFREQFGIDVKTLWLPDVFGYTAALPQIIKKCGMDNFMTIKLSWNRDNPFPHHSFLWTGLDDSEVLVHMPPLGDYTADADPAAVRGTWDKYRERTVNDEALMLYGFGDGGGGPGEYHVNMVERCAKLRCLPKVEHSTSAAFFRKLREHRDAFPTYKGELYLEKHRGTYTTQAKIKKNMRRCEALLHEAEWLATEASLLGREYPHEDFDRIWKEVLLHQFHDILPGSSVERVNREANERLEALQAELERIIRDSLNTLRISDRPAVLNPTDFARRGLCRKDGRWYQYRLAPHSQGLLQETAQQADLRASGSSIENTLLKLVIDEKGHITQLIRKATGKNYARTGFNIPRLYHDPIQVPFNAWDIDPDYGKLPAKDMTCVERQTGVDGREVWCRLTFRAGKSTLRQKISLVDGENWVRVENEVQWHETNRMLRIDAYPAEWSDEVLCDIQFGNFRRSTRTDDPISKAQFEIPAHKWVDVSSARGGVAILNDCKYGHRVKDGLISLNCLRAPIYPDPTADRGDHAFTYAIYPHEGAALDSELIRLGYGLNMPLRFAEETALTGPIAHADRENILLETVYRERDGRLVLRFYETRGQLTRTPVRVRPAFCEAFQTDMLTEHAEQVDLSDMTFKPYEIKTLVLTGAKERYEDC